MFPFLSICKMSAIWDNAYLEVEVEHPHRLSGVACPGVEAALWDAPLCPSQVLRHLVMSAVAIPLSITAPSLFQAVTGPSPARLPQDPL